MNIIHHFFIKYCCSNHSFINKKERTPTKSSIFLCFIISHKRGRWESIRILCNTYMADQIANYFGWPPAIPFNKKLPMLI